MLRKISEGGMVIYEAVAAVNEFDEDSLSVLCVTKELAQQKIYDWVRGQWPKAEDAEDVEFREWACAMGGGSLPNLPPDDNEEMVELWSAWAFGAFRGGVHKINEIEIEDGR